MPQSSNSADPRAAAAARLRRRAREIALDGLAAASEEEAESQAREALKLDPDCPDALLLLAQLEELSDQERLQRLRHALAAAERALPANSLQSRSGHLGEDDDDHPYLRARHQLAITLLESGEPEHLEEAIAHLEELLRLAPDPELGFAAMLLSACLMDHRIDHARRLLQQLQGDTSLLMELGRAVVLALSGERAQAAGHLRRARTRNRHLSSAIAHPEVLGRPVEDEYEAGSPDEARHALQLTLIPFAENRDLLDWFSAELRPQPAKERCRCGSGKKYKDCCGRESRM